MTVHSVRMLMPMAEIDTHYKERPPGSVSKLSTYKDGFRILLTIGQLVREERRADLLRRLVSRSSRARRSCSARRWFCISGIITTCRGCPLPFLHRC